MSIQALRERVAAKLLEAGKQQWQILQNVRFVPAHETKNGVVPASTAEALAMQAIEANAKIWAFSAAVQILEEEFKLLTDPKKPEGGEQQDEKEEDPTYG